MSTPMATEAHREEPCISCIYGKILVCSNRTIMFIKNAAHTQGGAIYVESDIDSTIVADNFSRLVFLNS